MHVLSIHVRDHATFNAVFRLLGERLQLPRVYGEPSTNLDSTERCYAGFSVGNAYLEPCGPYPSDPPFTPQRPARFTGLTFSPAVSLAASAAALDQLRIANSGVVGDAAFAQFVYLNDPLLTGPLTAAGIWRLAGTNHAGELPQLAASLRASQGGALAVQRLASIRLGVPGASQRAQWNRLLGGSSTARQSGPGAEGPEVELIDAEQFEVQSIVLEVANLAAARKALDQRGLPATTVGSVVRLEGAETCGLRIILREAPATADSRPRSEPASDANAARGAGQDSLPER